MFFSVSFLGSGLIPPYEPMNPAIEKFIIIPNNVSNPFGK